MNNENEIRWVHISDIHIGHEEYVENVMRDELPKFLKQLSEKRAFHFLFITGDLIFAPKYLEQKSGIKNIDAIRNSIENIQTSINIDVANTCISIGNHDVVRTSEKNKCVKKLVKTYRSSSGDISEEDNLYTAELRFSELYEAILNRKYPRGHFIEKIEVQIEESKKVIEVLNLDTVITAEAVQDDGETRVLQDGNLFIGTKKLKEILDTHNKELPIIAIGHHPLAALAEEEREAVVRELQNSDINIYLCGHTHIANVSLLGKKEQPLVQVCCGTNMERLENNDPADMTFEIGTFSLDKKSISIETYQYNHKRNNQWGWEKIVSAPFEQIQFEKDINSTTFYYPRKKAPYFSIIEKTSKELSKVVTASKFFVDPKLEIHPMRPKSSGSNPSHRIIYEADTGYGKSTLLRKLAYEKLQAFESHAIKEKIMNEKVVCPFLINLEHCYNKNDSFVAVLAKSIHLLGQSSIASHLFDVWINHLADAGRLLLLIDGLDKLEKKLLESFSEVLQQYVCEHPDVQVYITSKHFVFDSTAMQDKFEDYDFYQIKAFDDKQILEYCKNWYSHDNETVDDDSAQGRAEKFARQIIDDPPLKELASVPLLLNTLLQVKKETDVLPNNRVRLYDSFVYALLKDELYPELDIQLLAAIAYEMQKEHAYSLAAKKMKHVIQSIYAKCNWFQLNQLNRQTVCEFLSKMNNNSRLLQKVDNNYKFYNDEIQYYFVALALAKGFYIDLSQDLKNHNISEQKRELPLIKEVRKYFDNVEYSNILKLTILQLNTYETFLVVDELIKYINGNSDMTIVKSSHLRNLLLRIILDGAYVTKEQRIQSFEAVQRQNIFNLQADLLEEVWNSQYSDEFETTCSHYIVSLFKLLRDEDNPIQCLYDWISSDSFAETAKLEERLYVLDGVIWSKGRKYLKVFEATSQLEDLTSLLEKIIKSNDTDSLCKRRAYGVFQRLLEINAINDINRDLIGLMFEVFAINANIECNKGTVEDVNYAGIRIFHSIPLTNENISYIKSLKFTFNSKEYFIQLYENAQNAQDKLSAFEAAIFCKCWDYEMIQEMQVEEAFIKSKIIDMSVFNIRVQKLVDEKFFN